MKVFTTTRRIESSEQATAALDELARDNHLGAHCYDASVARLLSEFDALKWSTLCSQREALLQREYEEKARDWEVPARFLGIYKPKQRSETVRLENTDESLTEIAA